CTGELAELRSLNARTSALLGLVEAPAPVLAAQASFARARRGGAGRVFGGTRHLARAAALVVGFAGVAAAAVPGSPVRQWVEERIAPRPAAPAPVLRPEEAPAAAPEALRAPSGVSILPDAGRIRIVVTGSSPELRVRARLSSAPQASVLATGAAAGARFRTSPGRIEVMGAGAGEVRIDLPRTATSAFIEVNGRVYAAKEGDVLRALAPRVEGSTAAEPVFRAGS
ncbi:MAG TPA: hypothetical protein VFQ45_12620, partial [Longimicrobium sp.]|nr:hypothetical protein [Longimicrobium sp.]